MTPESATFLLQLLDKCQLNAGDPSFDKDVASIQNARVELRAFVPAPTEPDSADTPRPVE